MKLKELQTTYKKSILDAAEKRKAKDVRVFGSTVTGSKTPNDVDILVNL